ncbi:MAG: hypothetical protein PHH93_11400 [Prolixibacteraceae bacterium]|nr:hypothetical protein [Prolixibacteraceae bacterium]
MTDLVPGISLIPDMLSSVTSSMTVLRANGACSPAAFHRGGSVIAMGVTCISLILGCFFSLSIFI